jgi:hypothetical protein
LTIFVVDASVVINWVIEEEGRRARATRSGSAETSDQRSDVGEGFLGGIFRDDSPIALALHREV